jgi:hypothetical protein
MLTKTPASTIKPEDHHWSLFSNCSRVDPDRMFPGDKNEKQIARAKAVCDGNGTATQPGCPVREQCAAERFDEQYGVIAGMTAEERQALKRRQTARLRRTNEAA